MGVVQNRVSGRILESLINCIWNADFVACAALCEAWSADFVAGAGLCKPALEVQILLRAPAAFFQPWSVDFVANAEICVPGSADFVAGAGLWQRAKQSATQLKRERQAASGGTGSRAFWSVSNTTWSILREFWRNPIRITIYTKIDHVGSLVAVFKGR